MIWTFSIHLYLNQSELESSKHPTADQKLNYAINIVDTSNLLSIAPRWLDTAITNATKTPCAHVERSMTK